jgi:hypothetical protein
MFSQQPQQQFRTAGADVQIFYRDSGWSKPPGVSQIYMLLIGGGGNNNGSSSGGGSGAVTVWWGNAQNVPDSLVLSVSTGNASNTTVNYRGSGGLVALLTANAAVLDVAGTAMTANQFCASGFFASTAGQNGGGSNVTASTTTFLSGGGGSGNTVTANYGYVTASGAGTFQLQPIIVGSGACGSAATSGLGGIGCGGREASGVGGAGMILIASM